MKRSEQAFLELYNQYEQAGESTREEKDRCLEQVLGQAGLTRKTRPRPRIALLAAAVGAAALLAAAAYAGVSDLFRDVLREADGLGQPAPLSSMAPVVEKSGMLLDEAVESGGIQVTLRGAVGGSGSMRLIVDVENKAGAPLALRQADGSLSTDEIRFGKVELIPHREPTEGYGLGIGGEVLSGDLEKGKATLLITIQPDGIPVQGESFTLRLGELSQLATLEGRELALAPGALGELVAQFDEPGQEDYRISGYAAELATGEVEYAYLLEKDSGTALPLGVRDIVLTNAGIRDGALYLQGTAPESAGEVFEHMALRDRVTGEDKPFLNGGQDDDDNGTVVWNIGIGGVGSLEDLETLVWVYGAGDGLHPLAEGEWEFDFTMDIADSAIVKQPAQPLTWQGYRMTLQSLELSPYTLRLDLTATSAQREQLYRERVWGEYTPMTEWEQMERGVELKLRNGSTVVAGQPGGGLAIEADGSGTITLAYWLDVVIDPAQVEAIQVGDLEIIMKE